jgi:hypothetical protein
MSTAVLESRLTALWETPKSTYGWFATVDHKELGLRPFRPRHRSYRARCQRG